MKPPANHLIIQMDSAFQDRIVTESGVVLFKDTLENPEWNVTVTGRVVGVPDKLVSRQWHDEYKGLRIEAREGDEVIVSYMVVMDHELKERDTPVYANLFYHGGKYYWKVDYTHVLGFVREGKVVAGCGYVFCEELKGGGPQKSQSGLLWLPDMVQKEVPKGRARVVSVGAHRTDKAPISVSEGDIVRYPDKHAHKYEVHGRNYIVLDQDRVLGKEL